MIQLDVIRVEMAPGSTIAIGVGIDHGANQIVTFAGDWRPMADLKSVLESGGTPEAMIDTYQVVESRMFTECSECGVYDSEMGIHEIECPRIQGNS